LVFCARSWFYRPSSWNTSILDSLALLSTHKMCHVRRRGLAVISVPILIGVLNAPAICAQDAPATKPKFEVASIKRTGSCGGGALGVASGTPGLGGPNPYCLGRSSRLKARLRSVGPHSVPFQDSVPFWEVDLGF
jgi:hypothetical protein